MSSYTKDQEKIVLKILSYKPHQYYEILSVERSSDDGSIKKSYRKLAIKLHPDKNPHPRAAEAFKFVNKAWGVLSDPSKKRIYDQTGSDPDSRFGGGDSGGSSFARASGGHPSASFQGFQGGSPLDDDIFNLFFGGGANRGPAFTFGGNGFTFQSFGGGEHPYARQRYQPRSQTRPQQLRQEETSIFDMFKQFLPILLFLLVPLLSSLFSESSSVPDYSFNRDRTFNMERKTPKYNIPFYVSEKYISKKQLTKKQLRNFDYKVENVYVQDRRSKCSREQILKNEMMEDAQGWFSTDYDKLKQAENMPMPNCQELRKMSLI